MNRLSPYTPWLRLALAVLVAVWSGYGAVVRGEAFERDLAPWLGVGGAHGAPLSTGTASETGLGAAALTYALFWADGAIPEVPAGPDALGVRPRPGIAGRAWAGAPVGRHRSPTGARRPLRHLLCVYRL